MFTIISQLDPRWATKKLGSSNLIWGKMGCTSSCLIMLASYFGEMIDPLAFASNANNYTPDGLIAWTKLNFKKMKFITRLRERPSDAVIKEALKNPNKGILLEVNHSHWLLGLRPTFLGNDFVCADPWGGVKCNVQKKYKTITGCAIFERK